MDFRRVSNKRLILRGDKGRAASHIGEGNSLLHLCQVQAGFQELDHFQLVRNLEDGSRVVVRTYAGLSDVIIESPFAPVGELDSITIHRATDIGFLFDASADGFAKQKFFMWPNDYNLSPANWHLRKEPHLNSFNMNHMVGDKVLVSWKGPHARSLGFPIHSSPLFRMSYTYSAMFSADSAGASEHYKIVNALDAPYRHTYIQRFDNKLVDHAWNLVIEHSEKICGAAKTRDGKIICVTFDASPVPVFSHPQDPFTYGSGFETLGVNSFWKREGDEWELIGRWTVPSLMDPQHQCGWFFDDAGLEARCILVDRNGIPKNTVMRAVINESMSSVSVSSVPVQWSGTIDGTTKQSLGFTLDDGVRGNIYIGRFTSWMRTENSSNGSGKAVVAVDFANGRWVYAHVDAEDIQENIFERTESKERPQYSFYTVNPFHAWRREKRLNRRTIVLPNGASLDTYGHTWESYAERRSDDELTLTEVEHSSYPPPDWVVVRSDLIRTSRYSVNRTYFAGDPSRTGRRHYFSIYFMDLRFNELVYAVSTEENEFVDEMSGYIHNTATEAFPLPSGHRVHLGYHHHVSRSRRRVRLYYPRIWPNHSWKSKHSICKILSSGDTFFELHRSQVPSQEWDETDDGDPTVSRQIEWEPEVEDDDEEYNIEFPYSDHIGIYSAALPSTCAATLHKKTLACVGYRLIPGSVSNYTTRAFYFPDNIGSFVFNAIEGGFADLSAKRFFNIHLSNRI